jgi:hypothetical protein
MPRRRQASRAPSRLRQCAPLLDTWDAMSLATPLLAAVLLATSATALHAAALPPVSSIDELPCTPLTWIAFDGLSDHAAIKVPVELDGQVYWYQLDTGSDVTLFDDPAEASARGWKANDEGGVEVASAVVGGLALGPVQIHPREDDGGTPEAEVAGTLGLDLLQGQVVVLDFAAQRFCLARHAALSEGFRAQVAAVPAELRDGKLFVTPMVAGAALPAVFYDTGASAFPLVVDGDTWERITGRSGDDAAMRIEVPAWGQSVALQGAPIDGGFSIGDSRLDGAIAYHLADQPDLFKNWPFLAAGLLGNALFHGKVVVLDLGPDPSFGVMRARSAD